MTDEPDLKIVKVADPRGDGWRAERARSKEEAHRLYREIVVETLTELAHSPVDLDNQAAVILSALFAPTRIDGGEPCPCSCHPRLPESDIHGYGFDCSCQWTADERRRSFEAWSAEMDAYWASAEGQAITDEQAAQEATLTTWLAENPGVTVASHGGLAPEQWSGEVDGRSFYFRERHDQWRIEVDLRPTGRFYRAWVGGDLEDDNSFEERAIDAGDVIAEGTTSAHGYGTTPVERAQFITAAIRAHFARQACAVHRDELDDLEVLCGRPMNWCPACGLKLHSNEPNPW